MKAKIQIFSRNKLIYADLQETERRDTVVNSSTIRDVKERDRKFQRIVKIILLDFIPVHSFLFQVLLLEHQFIMESSLSVVD